MTWTLRFIHLIPVFGLAVFGLIWAGTENLIKIERQAVELQAQSTSALLAQVYEAHVSSALKEIDDVLDILRYVCKVKGSKVALSELQEHALFVQLNYFVVTVADSQGRVQSSNRSDAPSQISAEPYFQHLAHTKTLADSLYFTHVTWNPIAKDVELIFAKQLHGPGGVFAGVVAVAIHPAQLIGGYDAPQLGQQGSVGVADQQGVYLAQSLNTKVQWRTLVNPALQAAGWHADGQTKNITGATPRDGVVRYLSARRVKDFPLIAVVGLSQKEQFVAFDRARDMRLWQAGAASALVVVGTVLIYGFAMQLSRSRVRTRKAQDAYHAAAKIGRDAYLLLDPMPDAKGRTIDFRVEDANEQAAQIMGLALSDLMGAKLSALMPGESMARTIKALIKVVESGAPLDAEWRNIDSRIQAEWLYVQAVIVSDSVLMGVRDISERKQAESDLSAHNATLSALNDKLTQAHEQLVQSEKLASIGLLAAGVAHEINNPVGFVLSNFGSLDKYVSQLLELIDAYQRTEPTLAPELAREMDALRERIELPYLREDLSALMQETKDGIDRIRRIVQDLKNFSHVDDAHDWQLVNLHEGIESTLNIVNNEIKYKADVIKAFGDMAPVQCVPSEINQVIMNLTVNAAHAIGAERGRITIRTGQDGDAAWFEVEDTGCGIAPENLKRVFDPFFTTKPVGKGTGLGLSLSYGIVKKHHGQITIKSEIGKGTIFRVTLPVGQPIDDGDVQPAKPEEMSHV
jgi:two-component system NtrC family sensor kinase